jgi:hypothetical protein
MAGLLVLALVACRSKKIDDRMPDPSAEHDDASVAAPADAPAAWPELADYPHTQAVRVIALPAKADVPRFDVGGPVLAGDVAVVSSSQFGFAAVDWRRGTIAWTKPTGEHVAPPVVVEKGRERSVVLIGECVNPPQIRESEVLLGCVRVVTFGGADEGYTAIRGGKALASFALAPGTQSVWLDGDKVRWRRGDAAVRVDLVSGVAVPASAVPPPLSIAYKDRHWDIAQVGGKIVATDKGRELWKTSHAYTAVLGAVWLPDQSPMLRITNLGAYGKQPEVILHDMDATGSLRGQTARPSPGIGVLGWGISSVGDAAIAVRLDRSLRRDYIVGYAANAMLMWTYTLPEMPRADPVGVAVAPDAVLAFHDGDTFTVLPELSAPPTSPGAVRPPSQNPTP